MLGNGNFTSEIQVELNMDEVTSARESYDKDGVVRAETQQQSQSTATAPSLGIPGVLSNTPHSATQAQPEFGRASCRERVCQYVSSSLVAVLLKPKRRQVFKQ